MRHRLRKRPGLRKRPVYRHMGRCGYPDHRARLWLMRNRPLSPVFAAPYFFAISFDHLVRPLSSRPCRKAATTFSDSAADLLLRNPITGIAGSCARAARGQATNGEAVAPPSSAMNARRLMEPATARSEAQACFSAACETRSLARMRRRSPGAWPRCSQGPRARHRPARRAARMRSGRRIRPGR
jgi:hypothetical protein